MTARSHNFAFLTLFLFAISGISTAQTLLSADSIHLQWERLEGPAAYVAQFAQNGNLLFAAGEEALYSSADQGLSWQYNQALGRKRIRQLFANEKMVLVLVEEPKAIYPGFPFTPYEIHQMFRSTDGGQSWQQVLTLIQDFEQGKTNVPYEIMALNDSTIIFNYLSYTYTSSTERIYASLNDGKDWTDLFHGAKLLQTCRDTLAYLTNPTKLQPLLGKITPHLHFSAGQTVDLSATGANLDNLLKVGYRDGAFFLFLNNKTLWTTRDLGASWSSNSLPIPGDLLKITWADSVFYAIGSKGVYRASPHAPLQLENVYTGGFSQSARVKSFSSLPTGYWINTDLNEIITQTNEQNWAPRSKGLSSKVGKMRSECGALRV